MIRTKLSDLKKQSPLSSKNFNYLAGELLNLSPEKLTADFSTLSLSPQQLIKFNKIHSAILSGIPPQQVFKKAYFYNNEFIVNKSVLIPRPETELLIEQAELFIKKNNRMNLQVLDLATGSGVIGITLKKIFPDLEITASDLSSSALKIAVQNAKKHQVKINFIQSDLFEKINRRFDLICTNLPYISENDPDLGGLYDPRLALVGGKTGFELIEKTIKSLNAYLNHDGAALFEFGYDQADKLSSIASKSGFSARIITDLNNYDRLAILEYLG